MTRVIEAINNLRNKQEGMMVTFKQMNGEMTKPFASAVGQRAFPPKMRTCLTPIVGKVEKKPTHQALATFDNNQASSTSSNQKEKERYPTMPCSEAELHVILGQWIGDSVTWLPSPHKPPITMPYSEECHEQLQAKVAELHERVTTLTAECKVSHVWACKVGNSSITTILTLAANFTSLEHKLKKPHWERVGCYV
ncbi:hypothetical protein FNV43_RR10292 [Rhamnella rubrinervis]|uniref:Uncharacterized protein n=1 Tax=Rhamnella rubrinervis TaxID=2594499 RepID=A0A8K0HCY9_9ROSA|nr:hypothetical protein FNV43_RR10292 [Rhamnella rubrinervis]